MSAPLAHTTDTRPSFGIQAIASAFGAVVVLWAGFFLGNLPGMTLPQPVLAPILAGLLVGAIAMSVRHAGERAGWKLGLVAGLIAGLVNLLALGTLLSTTSLSSPDPSITIDSSLKPGAPLIALGFLIACAIGGALGGLIARTIARQTPLGAHAWLSRFAWIAAIATLELILVGGLVTSSESGLAVPDWPGTYGANMFLYPIALMGDHRVFLEHSHRLFGTMVGLTTLTLAASVIAMDKRRIVRVMAGVLALLVIFQGVLGGLRVTEQSAWLGVFHGVLAQLFLALLVAQAVWLHPAWMAMPRSPNRDFRRWKFVATAATHTTILQLALGAMYRHTASFHALMAHLGFSVVVIVFAIMASAGAMSLDAPPDALRKRGPILAKTILAVVALQVMLGVGALFAVLGTDREGVPTADQIAQDADLAEVPIHEMLLATAHQANGAILLALLTMSMVWAKRVYRKP